MSTNVAVVTPSAQPAPVAPSRQCIGCGFDVVGIAMDGVCSECQKPVRETVQRPMLRESRRSSRQVLLGSRFLIAVPLGTCLLAGAFVAAELLEVDLLSQLLENSLMDWGIMLTFTALGSIGSWLIARGASQSAAVCALVAILPLTPAVDSAIEELWFSKLNLFAALPWRYTLHSLVFAAAVIYFILVTRLIAACALRWDSFSTHRHARRLAIATSVWAPLMLSGGLIRFAFQHAAFLADESTRARISDIREFHQMVVLIASLPATLALTGYAVFVLTRLVKAAKAEATFASTLPP